MSGLDRNGNVHDQNGRYVSLQRYVERIFDERDRAAEYSRMQMEKALEQAKMSSERALGSAKEAADEVSAILTKRIENLEAGGAPFASRLDDSFKAVKQDVEELKLESVGGTSFSKAVQDRVDMLQKAVEILQSDSVRQGVLDEIRKQNEKDIAANRDQIKRVLYMAISGLVANVVLLIVTTFLRK